jgi:hypothetical protein
LYNALEQVGAILTGEIDLVDHLFASLKQYGKVNSQRHASLKSVGGLQQELKLKFPSK